MHHNTAPVNQELYGARPLHSSTRDSAHDWCTGAWPCIRWLSALILSRPPNRTAESHVREPDTARTCSLFPRWRDRRSSSLACVVPRESPEMQKGALPKMRRKAGVAVAGSAWRTRAYERHTVGSHLPVKNYAALLRRHPPYKAHNPLDAPVVATTPSLRAC